MSKEELYIELETLRKTLDPTNEYAVQVVSTKRFSKNANAYAWVLQDQMASKLKLEKDEMHRLMLERYGQTKRDKNGVPIVFSVISEVDATAFYPYISITGHGSVNGKEFTHYRVLKGSTDFTTDEMAVFIDGVVQEAKELGIETLTPDSIERMKSMWGGK